MKHVYVLATAVLSMLTFGASAQIYTAVRDGDWSIGSGAGTPWDPSGKPTTNCNNCTIVIKSGVKVTLDVHVELTGTSTLTLGDGGSGSAQLIIPGSGGSSFAAAHNIVLSSAGTDNTKIRVLAAGSFVDATGAATYDGVFAHNGSYLKQVGNTPWTIFGSDGTPELTTTVEGGNFLNGPSGINGSGPLPITLEAFTATLDKGGVTLYWTTAQESNSDHTLVERSTDGGRVWTTLGKVQAAGNSSLPLNYSFTDANPSTGYDQYRLQFVDRDGRSAYSFIRSVHSAQIATVSVFPNPATDVVNVTLGNNQGTGLVTIHLVSNSGQLLAEKRIENGAGMTISLPVSGYPQGNYLLVVMGADGSRQVSKVAISR